MAKQRKRTRVWSKIDDLPEDVKAQVDAMIADLRNSYTDISEFLKSKEYDISRGAVYRYAARSNNARQRLVEAQQHAKALIDVVQANPDVDYTEGAMQMLMGALTEKLAMAQDEIEDMPLDKAGRLIVALSRTDAYKRKLSMEFSKGVSEAIKRVKEEIRKELSGEPELLRQLSQLVDRVGERMEPQNE